MAEHHDPQAQEAERAVLTEVDRVINGTPEAQAESAMQKIIKTLEPVQGRPNTSRSLLRLADDVSETEYFAAYVGGQVDLEGRATVDKYWLFYTHKTDTDAEPVQTDVARLEFQHDTVRTRVSVASKMYPPIPDQIPFDERFFIEDFGGFDTERFFDELGSTGGFDKINDLLAMLSLLGVDSAESSDSE